VKTAESINKIIDVPEENEHDPVLMACIASYVELKSSPKKTVGIGE